MSWTTDRKVDARDYSTRESSYKLLGRRIPKDQYPEVADLLVARRACAVATRRDRNTRGPGVSQSDHFTPVTGCTSTLRREAVVKRRT